MKNLGYFFFSDSENFMKISETWPVASYDHENEVGYPED